MSFSFAADTSQLSSLFNGKGKAALKKRSAANNLSATSAVGSVTQRTTAVIPITFDPEAVGQVGSVTVTGGATVNLTGVEGSGQVGTVVVWGRIIPDEDTVWTEIIAA